MNAAQLSRIAALLSRIDALEIRYGDPVPIDPRIVGALRTEAFICSLDISAALRRIEVPISPAPPRLVAA